MEPNEKLVNALREARASRLSRSARTWTNAARPPSTYGVYLSANKDGAGNVLSQQRKPRAVEEIPDHRRVSLSWLKCHDYPAEVAR